MSSSQCENQAKKRKKNRQKLHAHIHQEVSTDNLMELSFRVAHRPINMLKLLKYHHNKFMNIYVKFRLAFGVFRWNCWCAAVVERWTEMISYRMNMIFIRCLIKRQRHFIWHWNSILLNSKTSTLHHTMTLSKHIHNIINLKAYCLSKCGFIWRYSQQEKTRKAI